MSIASLVDSNDIEAFVTVYTAMSDIIDQINDRIPENVKALYATVIKYATKENLKGLASSLKYMRTSESGSICLRSLITEAPVFPSKK